MRRIFYLAAVVVSLGASAHVLAQGGSTSFSGGGGGGGTGLGGGGGGTGFGGGGGGTGLGGGGGGTGFSGGGGGNSFTGGGGASFTGGGGASFTGGGSTTGGGRTSVGGGRAGGSGTSTFTPSTTGIFAGYYANPLFPGRPGSTNLSNKTVGGFGQPSFGTLSSITTQGGGLGGRNGTATVGNRNGINSSQTSVTPITYALEVKFSAPPIVAPQLQADLQGLMSRTTALKTPGTVRVEVSGNTVILRGRVADDDERRLVEGMVRLEPGVQDVRNELTIP